MLNHFTTERLIADRLREAHLDDLLRMDQDPRIMKTLGGVRTEEESREYLRRNLDHWEEYGVGPWMLRLRDGENFVGRAYLRFLHITGTDEIGLGYALIPEYWGIGLATEIASAIVDIAFSQLAFDSVVAGSLPDNIASRNVLEKIGGRCEMETVYKGLPHVVYRIERRNGDSSRTVILSRHLQKQSRLST
ncbi:MAG TPA: GNAT family N-acetyltransferase [Rhodothermales bacterium]|nr:GNAT family N-acetyltransferase [Rhodothermales bacterium]